MNTKQKNSFYNAVMNSKSTSVNESENVGGYFIWYSNMEDVSTDDMSDDEIEAYREGWKVSGPYKSKAEAFKAMKRQANNDILDYWFCYEDQYFRDNDADPEGPSDETKLEYMKDFSDYSESADKITFGSEDFGVNTMVYEIKTEDEIL